MSNYRRPRLSGSSIFFTVAAARRGGSLLTDHIDRLRAAIGEARRDRPFRIDAIVILPDHLHAVWTLPEDDSDYSTRWAAIKAGFSRGLPPGKLRDSHILRREKGLWQRRFWEHHLRNENAMREAVRYCWTNPVKHGLVPDPGDWPYSSIHHDGRPSLAG